MGPILRLTDFLFPVFTTLVSVCATHFFPVDGQTTCQIDVCSSKSFGLNCDSGVLHINEVRCGEDDPQACIVAKQNLMILCTGQRACAAKGLKTLLKPCRSRFWSQAFVNVNYSCVPEAILTRTCSGDIEEEIGNRQAIIMSPGYPDSSTDVKYNFCHWAFTVPVWQNAQVSIHHLTSRQTLGRCDSALLQLRYTLCNGGGFKTENFCGVVDQEEVRLACGRVHILARGFDPQYDAGTKFLISVKVDSPRNLKSHGSPHYTMPCGGQPSKTTYFPPNAAAGVVDILSPTTQATEDLLYNDSVKVAARSPRKESAPYKISRTVKMVLILTLAGIIVIVLLAAIVVVCLKTAQSGNYKLREAEAMAVARRRSKDPEATRFDHTGMNGHKPGKASIEDLDDDLIINGLRDSRCENSPTKQHYMTIDQDDTPHPRNGSLKTDPHTPPDVIDHTYSSYASIDDDATALTSSEMAYPGTVLYEEPDACRNGYVPNRYPHMNGDCDSIDGDYDNVPRTADVQADVEHYCVDGDDYAIVTKSRKSAPANGTIGGNGLYPNSQSHVGVNGGYHVTPKPVYVNRSGNVILADTYMNNHIGYGEGDERYY